MSAYVELVGAIDIGCDRHTPVLEISVKLVRAALLSALIPGVALVSSIAVSSGVAMAKEHHHDKDWKADDGSALAAPEIDPTFAASGLALLAGGLLVLRSRAKK